MESENGELLVSLMIENAVHQCQAGAERVQAELEDVGGYKEQRPFISILTLQRTSLPQNLGF